MTKSVYLLLLAATCWLALYPSSACLGNYECIDGATHIALLGVGSDGDLYQIDRKIDGSVSNRHLWCGRYPFLKFDLGKIGLVQQYFVSDFVFPQRSVMTSGVDRNNAGMLYRLLSAGIKKQLDLIYHDRIIFKTHKQSGQESIVGLNTALRNGLIYFKRLVYIADHVGSPYFGRSFQQQHIARCSGLLESSNSLNGGIPRNSSRGAYLNSSSSRREKRMFIERDNFTVIIERGPPISGDSSTVRRYIDFGLRVSKDYDSTASALFFGPCIEAGRKYQERKGERFDLELHDSDTSVSMYYPEQKKLFVSGMGAYLTFNKHEWYELVTFY